MKHQAQDALTILASGIIFGSAGLWLVPNHAKGAIVGAAAGAAVAAGHVQQDKKLKRLAYIQNQVNTLADQKQVDVLTDRITQVGEKTKEIAAKNQEDIRKIESVFQKKYSQIGNNICEIKKLKDSVKSLESNSCEDSAASVNDIERIDKRLTALESSLNLVRLLERKPSSEAMYKEPIADKHEDTEDSEAAQAVIEWFKGRQIEVENYYEPDPKTDALLDGLSLYLGDNYSVLNKFHWKLRSSVGKKANFDLGNYDARAKSIHNQYLKKLISSDY
ncbi:MAG: hypothetical protein WBC73_18970, partial [Phormidesmis sp.]